MEQAYNKKATNYKKQEKCTQRTIHTIQLYIMREALRRCIADATDRKSAAAGAQFTTEWQRRRRGHFRKLALSTDKFILNVISRR